MRPLTDIQFEKAISGNLKSLFPSTLTKGEVDGVVADNLRAINFDIIYKLSMEAADRIDKSDNIDDLIASIKMYVSRLVAITGGYNSVKVSELCGKHIIDDVKSMDSKYIRSRWVK